MIKDKIRKLFAHTTAQLDANQVPQLQVPADLSFDSFFDPQLKALVLHEIKTKTVEMFQNPYHLHKLLLVAELID